MPDIAGDDALEVVGGPGDVDKLERRAESCGLAVEADLEGQLGVGPKLLRGIRREDGAGLQPRRGSQVAEDRLEVLFALDDPAADLPTDTLGPRSQLGAPLQQLDPQRKRDTLVERYEAGTSASFSNCRSECALLAAWATKPPPEPGLRLLLLKSTYAFSASSESSFSGSSHSRSSASE